MSALITRERLKSLFQIALAGACFIVAAILIILFFRNIPFDIDGATFGIDWQHIWLSIQNGHIHFDDWLLIVPWTVVVVLPLGFLSVRDSWAILTLLTLCVLLLSLPRAQKKKWLFWLSAFLLITSYPNLRELVDGNFEGLVIAGVLIFLYGYTRQNALIAAIGALFMVTKPQDTWLLALAGGWFMWKNWPRTKLVTFGLLIVIVLIPCLLWLGPAWIAAVSQAANRVTVDITLKALMAHVELSPVWLVGAWLIIFSITTYVVLRSGPILSRPKACFVMCASLLLAPHAEGNSLVILLAIGIIPLMLVRPWRAAVLILLADIPFVISPVYTYQNATYYWFTVLMVAWAILGWYVYRSDVEAAPDPNTGPTDTNLRLQPFQP